MDYTIFHYIYFFFVYSFLGWVFDEIVAAFKYGKFVNRGFVNGPLVLKHGLVFVIAIADTKDMGAYPVVQLITCIILSLMLELAARGIMKAIIGSRKFSEADYLFNMGSATFVANAAAWGCIIAMTLWLVHPMVAVGADFIPLDVLKIIEIVLSVALFIDLIVSFAALFNWKLKGNIYGNVAKGLEKTKVSIGDKIFGFIVKRMYRSFPELELQAESEKSGFGVPDSKRVFARELGVYKLIWIYFISGLVGDLIETIFMLITTGEITSRSSLIYGPFSIVWGLGGALASALLYPARKKNPAVIFVGGFFLGGVYEYSCSVFTEVVFGTVFWDYSSMPFNINGRVNLLYCLFWGVAAIAWMKIVYPAVSFLVEKIPPIAGTVMTWVLVVIMVLDMAISGIAISRYVMRAGGAEAKNAIERFCDYTYPDSLIDRVYPYMKIQ